MRVSLARFGSAERPVGLWQDRLAPILLPVVIPLGLAAVLLRAAAGAALFLAWAAVSPVLPRSWRVNLDTAFELDPSVDAGCPACQARLTPGPVDRGHVLRTDGGREVVLPAQVATCPRCRRAFRRLCLGKVWSAWRQAPTPQD